MKIAILGAAGDVGGRMVSEALARGHTVTGVARSEAQLAKLADGVLGKKADVWDSEALGETLAGQDVVVSALRPREGFEEDLGPLTVSAMSAAKEAGIRALIVGGAASLRLPDGSGHTVLSAPGFLPPAVEPIARACNAQYFLWMDRMGPDDSYLCPPAMLTPGKRSGSYRLGSDFLLADAGGESCISMEDFAVAMIDEAENARHKGRRFTVAY
ncbi:NAD(P)H-binding protein [Limibacillus sp. MBR-115]|jgi:putative NADH-flavin reductase|uniref:NAD(P)-dependent oxidoreductase n=1 Tax=Limibacillus sp. MBR-115 TaxID=3156465 RepID=UPI00339A394D